MLPTKIEDRPYNQVSSGTMIPHCQKCIGKNRIHLKSFIVTYDFIGVIFTHSVPTGTRVSGVYYSYFLENNLQPAVRRKCPNLLNSHPIVLHDGARSNIAACG